MRPWRFGSAAMVLGVATFGVVSAVLAVAQKSTLNPQMKVVLDEFGTLGPTPIERLAPEEARKQPTPADGVKSLLRKKGI